MLQIQPFHIEGSEKPAMPIATIIDNLFMLKCASLSYDACRMFGEHEKGVRVA